MMKIMIFTVCALSLLQGAPAKAIEKQDPIELLRDSRVKVSLSCYLFKIVKDGQTSYVLGMTYHSFYFAHDPRLSRSDCRVFDCFDALLAALKTCSAERSAEHDTIFLFTGQSCVYTCRALYPDARMLELSPEEMAMLKLEFADFVFLGSD